MLPHPLTNFEIQNCYQNEPELNGVYSRNNLLKVKDGTYVILLSTNQQEPIRQHYVHGVIVTYFESFGTEQIPKEIKIFIGNKNFTTNIYRIQVDDLIICRSFCIGFINFILKGKSLLNYINIFSPNKNSTNEKTILEHFQ